MRHDAHRSAKARVSRLTGVQGGDGSDQSGTEPIQSEKKGPKREAREGGAPPEARKREAGSLLADGVDLNRATFKQLRELALSIVEAKQLIGERGARGGFASMEELDELRGFPMQRIEALKRRTHLEPLEGG